MRTVIRVSCALLVAIGAAGATIAAQAKTPAWAPQVDKVFSQWDRRDSPGCALGVFENGAIAYERGYGMADIEHDVPIAPDSVFYVGSLSKQFTAMAAALAVQQGKLSPDDSIRKYLPELPDYATAIKVRHLIHHTSGLRDYNTLLSIAGRRGDEAYDNPTVLRMTARQRSLNFQPGAEYLYSNTGYTLLAIVVERATGSPFAAFADAHIFRPLGMTASHFHVDASRMVKNRAMAYAPAGAGRDVQLDTPSNERAGAGGVFTSVRELLRWDNNFYDGRVGGKPLVETLHATEPLGDGKPSTYAWGLMIGMYRGLKLVEHSGSLGGYRAHLLRFPDQRTSVAALCNMGSINPGGLAREVADLALGPRLTEVKTAPRATTGAGSTQPAAAAAGASGPLTDYPGEYHSDEIDATFTVSIDGDRLMLRRESDAAPAAFQPGTGDLYRARGMTVRFERGTDGKVTALVVDAGRVRDIRFSRLPESKPRMDTD